MELFESSSSWIIALGKTLVHSLWAGILVLAILKLFFLAIPHRFPAARYRMAVAALFLFTLAMALTFLLLYTPAGATGTGITEGGIRIPVYLEASKGAVLLQLLFFYGTCFYLIGIVFYALTTGLSYLRIRSIRNSGRPVEGEWFRKFIVMKERAGVSRNVMFLSSCRIQVPVLAGFIKPAIIVPAGMFTQMPFVQVEMIIMHELFHLKRLDHLVNLLQRLAEIIFFYHPAIRALSQTIRRERENCCDDLVLCVCPDPVHYARALYCLASSYQAAPTLVPAATGHHRGHLMNRIQRILNQKIMKTNIRERLSALLLICGAVLIIVILSGFSSGLSINHYHQDPEADYSGPKTVTPVEVLPEVSAAPEASAILPPQPDTLQAPPGFVKELDPEEVRKAVREAMESIDWEQIKNDMETARREAMESIDWEQIKKEIEAAREELQKTMEDMDWEQFRNDMDHMKLHLDSLQLDLNMDFDFDFDFKGIEDIKVGN